MGCRCWGEAAAVVIGWGRDGADSDRGRGAGAGPADFALALGGFDAVLEELAANAAVDSIGRAQKAKMAIVWSRS
jgi:hypothetical protein